MKQALLLILIIATSFSCKQDKKAVQSTKIEGISLDDGKLWQANSETTEGIKTMQNILNSFSEDGTVTAYASLKGDLETEFTNIFQKCTMKGESHNQLHNYLKPMLPMFDALESTDSMVREKAYDNFKRHLTGYANYFE